MTVTWTRSALAVRVTVLAAEHEGDAFVEAVAELAGTLSEDERAALGEILLERAGAEGAYRDALERRIDEPRWWFLRAARRGGGGRAH
ncbi:MAG: hypothetical protein M3322_00090 [Actinomycetota bacterium]|nr:hypothetical protein [Actinomycetota bacterium]